MKLRSSYRSFVLALTLVAAGLLSAVSTGRANSGVPGYAILPLVPMGRANQATIRVDLNGRSTMLILDTGASATLLDTHFYSGARSQSADLRPDQLPPELRRNVSANGEHAEVGYIDSLKANEMDFGKGPVVVSDLKTILGSYNNYHGRGSVAGLLGEDLLRRYSAIIDWRRRGVYFNTDPSKRMKLGPGLIGAGWTAIPMAPTNARQFAVQCTVDDKPVRLVVDTGADFTTFQPGVVPLNVIYNRDTKSSMMRLAPMSETASMIGLDTIFHPAKLERWKIGSYELASTNVAVNKLPPGLLAQQSAGEGPILGLLGSEILAKNNAIIDIAGAMLYLKPGNR